MQEELIYLILQFLDEENLKGTCHKYAVFPLTPFFLSVLSNEQAIT